MKSMVKLFGLIVLVAVIGFSFTGCPTDNDGSRDDDSSRDLRYSIQVNNQAAVARAIAAGDTIELYIHHLEYSEDANPRALILIASGDRDQGSKGGMLNNAGWYSVNAELAVTNDVNNGPYSSFVIGISKLRVDGNEYDFPSLMGDGVIFGTPSRNNGLPQYPGNFNGINIDDSTVSLKTILTVEPDIIGEPDSTGYDSQGLATDPFLYIKVEGRINE